MLPQDLIAAGSLNYRTLHAETCRVARGASPVAFCRRDGRLVVCGYGTVGTLAPDDLAAYLIRTRHANDDPIDPASVTLTCDVDLPDAARAELLAGGYTLPHATRAEHRAANRANDAEVRRRLDAIHDARSGGQALDDTPPLDVAPVVTFGHVLSPGANNRPTVRVRLKSVGYGALDDNANVGSIEACLPKVNAIVHYAADALPGPRGGFAGSWTGGPLVEVCYDLIGTRWYLYVVTMHGVDDWGQEWWTSPTRLTSHAAADAIESAREFVRSRT